MDSTTNPTNPLKGLGKNKKKKLRKKAGATTAGQPGAQFSRADTGLVKQLFNTQPEMYLNFLANHAGLNTDTNTPFGAFYDNEVKKIVAHYNAAVADQPDLSFTKYMHLNPNYGSPDLNGLDPTGKHSAQHQADDNGAGYLNALLNMQRQPNQAVQVGGNGPGNPVNKRKRKLKVS